MTSEGKIYKFKEVSTRLIRPTQPEIDIPLLMKYMSTWQSSYEMGEVVVYDEGLAQYLLCDRDSHHMFFVALILGKPSLRCRLRPGEEEAPVDQLEECGNRLTLIGGTGEAEETQAVEKLKQILGKKNYKFVMP